MASSPLVEDSNIASFTILSGGTEIPSTYEIMEIRIEQQLNKIAEAEITIRDGSAAEEKFTIADADTFKPGVSVEIQLGYDGKESSIFKGIVTKQNIKINDSQGSMLHVVCKDKAVKMAVNRKNAVYTNVKDSDIITTITGNYSLSNDITSTTVEHKEVVQFSSVDWDFIVNRAEVNGLVVLTDSGKLTVAKPNVSASPDLELTFGYDIIEFDGELDATHQLSEVESNAWDISSQQVINATASEPTINTQGNISATDLSSAVNSGSTGLYASVPLAQDAIKSWADAALLKSRLSRFKGTLLFQGSSNAKPNTCIKLIGMGARFDGNAFVTGVVHSIEEGTWKSEVRIGLSEDWFVDKHPVSMPTASGLLPGVKGLQTGIVKKIYEDPDNQFRVQVQIPILGSDAESVWARLATFYTGNTFGAYFMPEVNDEVILGFMNDDPRFPIILGSVYSSSIAPSETPEEKNSIKTLVTQSKLQLKFDDENKVITILTPGGNTLVISDQDEGITLTDQNKNQIQMNSSGIVVESKSNLTLKADNKVDIQGTSVTINGDQSIDATGGNVSVTGNQSTKVSGSMSCAVSSDGEMSVKGLTVMLN